MDQKIYNTILHRSVPLKWGQIQEKPLSTISRSEVRGMETAKWHFNYTETTSTKNELLTQFYNGHNDYLNYHDWKMMTIYRFYSAITVK